MEKNWTGRNKIEQEGTRLDRKEQDQIGRNKIGQGGTRLDRKDQY